MKRILFLILAIALILTPSALAADVSDADDARPEDGIVTYDDGVITYDSLTRLVVDGNSHYREYAQEIDKLDTALKAMASQHSDLMDGWAYSPAAFGSTIISLQKSIKHTQEVFDDLSDSLPDLAAKLTFAAEKMYMAHFALSLDLDIAQRKLAALESDLELCRRKLVVGLDSKNAFDSLERDVKNGRDSVKAAQKEIDNNLELLAKFLGLELPITLGEMPDIDVSRIADRDLVSDRAAYRLAAPSVSEKEQILKAAKREFDHSAEAKVERFVYDTARSEYDKALADAERDFPDVYAKLYDAYEDYTELTFLADAEKEVSKMESRHSAGLVPENMLLTARRGYQEAVLRDRQLQISLWLKLMDYEFNLIHLDI